MHRFYAQETTLPADGLAHLTEEDARHAVQVLRMQPGQEAELFLGGARYLTKLETVSTGDVSARIVKALPSTEAALRVTLYQGLPKADKMELIVQKACELGAERVVPVAMNRCVVKLDGKDGVKKRDRWQKIAHEACKQSGRSVEMEVTAPMSEKAFLQALATHEAVLVPWEDAEERDLVAFHAAHPEVRNVAVVIGPEGGMSPEEVARMEAEGALPITLGPRILRTETAGLCALSVLFALYP